MWGVWGGACVRACVLACLRVCVRMCVWGRGGGGGLNLKIGDNEQLNEERSASAGQHLTTRLDVIQKQIVAVVVSRLCGGRGGVGVTGIA